MEREYKVPFSEHSPAVPPGDSLGPRQFPAGCPGHRTTERCEIESQALLGVAPRERNRVRNMRRQNPWQPAAAWSSPPAPHRSPRARPATLHHAEQPPATLDERLAASDLSSQAEGRTPRRPAPPASNRAKPMPTDLA